MDDFEFPTNVKQIGTIGQGIRIYLEDYVHSYLQQYSNSADYDERIGLLVGRYLVIDGEKVLFISGAIQGVSTNVENGITVFTQKSWAYAREQIKKYFRGLEIVGWVQSQPGYGTFLNTNYAEYHMQNFIKDYQAMFVMDPKDKVNGFYCWNETLDGLFETQGYFVYFDKNNGMHEYMLNNKILSLNEGDKFETKFKTLKKSANYNTSDSNEDIAKAKFSKHPGKTKVLEPKSHIEHLMSNKDANEKFKLESKQEKKPSQTKKVNMLTTLSILLLFTSLVMGFGLIASEGRISSLEYSITSLNTSYENLMLEIYENNAQSVFAPQDTTEDLQNDALATPGSSLVSNENIQDYTPAENNSQEPMPSPTQVFPPIVEEVLQTQEVPMPQAQLSTEIPEFYVVQVGDSLGYISTKFFGDRSRMEDIMVLNEMDNPDMLFFGRKLLLPQD
jgi:hypothetical protein